jgi:hypothetical protein
VLNLFGSDRPRVTHATSVLSAAIATWNRPQIQYCDKCIAIPEKPRVGNSYHLPRRRGSKAQLSSMIMRSTSITSVDSES